MLKKMKKIALNGQSLGYAALIALAVLGPAAKADLIKINMTVDNSYALFLGTATSATTFIGSDFSWPTTETYNFNLATSQYIYVTTASDLSAAQGFLGQFENLTSGYKFYSNDAQWQVMATNLGSNAPYTGSATDLALLTTQIQLANGGGTFSNGWVGTTAGPSNGAGPWGARPNIDAAAKWVWYSSNGDSDPTTPGYNHAEWLTFRIAVAATPTNPVPSVPDGGTTLAMLGGALAGLGALRRKFRA